MGPRKLAEPITPAGNPDNLFDMQTWRSTTSLRFEPRIIPSGCDISSRFFPFRLFSPVSVQSQYSNETPEAEFCPLRMQSQVSLQSCIDTLSLVYHSITTTMKLMKIKIALTRPALVSYYTIALRSVNEPTSLSSQPDRLFGLSFCIRST